MAMLPKHTVTLTFYSNVNLENIKMETNKKIYFWHTNTLISGTDTNISINANNSNSNINLTLYLNFINFN